MLSSRPIQSESKNAQINPWKNQMRSQAPFWVRNYDFLVQIITLGRTKTIHRGTLAVANIQKGEDILDIGCGTGTLLLEAEKMLGKTGKLVGLDPEPEMVRQANKKAAKIGSSVKFEAGSIEDIPFPKESFDAVISSLMFHHLSEEQKTAGLAELIRVLKPHGRLLIMDLNPNRRGILTSLPRHNQLEHLDYVQQEAVILMAKSGFKDIESGEHTSRQFSYAVGWKVAK